MSNCPAYQLEEHRPVPEALKLDLTLASRTSLPDPANDNRIVIVEDLPASLAVSKEEVVLLDRFLRTRILALFA